MNSRGPTPMYQERGYPVLITKPQTTTAPDQSHNLNPVTPLIITPDSGIWLETRAWSSSRYFASDTWGWSSTTQLRTARDLWASTLRQAVMALNCHYGNTTKSPPTKKNELEMALYNWAPYKSKLVIATVNSIFFLFLSSMGYFVLNFVLKTCRSLEKHKNSTCDVHQVCDESERTFASSALLYIVYALCGLLGECVLALKSAFAAQPQSFKTVLTHVGEETGTIK